MIYPKYENILKRLNFPYVVYEYYPTTNKLHCMEFMTYIPEKKLISYTDQECILELTDRDGTVKFNKTHYITTFYLHSDKSKFIKTIYDEVSYNDSIIHYQNYDIQLPIRKEIANEK